MVLFKIAQCHEDLQFKIAQCQSHVALRSHLIPIAIALRTCCLSAAAVGQYHSTSIMGQLAWTASLNTTLLDLS